MSMLPNQSQWDGRKFSLKLLGKKLIFFCCTLFTRRCKVWAAYTVLYGALETNIEEEMLREMESLFWWHYLVPYQIVPEARTILGFFYYESWWSIFLLRPVWVGFSVFIHTRLTDLEMFILKREAPRRNTTAFQIFEGCWVEELPECSVCPLDLVGRCFRWSDFRSAEEITI